jgi:predicted AAA+ superfamily ATPase
MKQIPRYLKAKILRQLSESNKAIILYGARQVGKTTLVRELLSEQPLRFLEVNADEGRFIDVLSSRDSRRLRELASGYGILFIDEAQRVPEIGLNLKILIDTLPELRIIATGSSSLELASGVSEPLTGRKWTYLLFPISQLELRGMFNNFELKQELDSRLIWGSYPEVFSFTDRETRIKYLRELSGDYLYKDVLQLADVRSADKIRALLKLLAFQIGAEVSLSELGNSLELSRETVARYLDLLEKSFVLFRLSGFSRNLRKEVTKSNKFYFFDTGIRNAIIDNFSFPSERNDMGQLWENFLISERLKRNSYLDEAGNSYFWRTYTGSEIDYVEDAQGTLRGYEIKYRAKKAREPRTFLDTYENSSWCLVNSENWLDFLV